MGNFPIGKLLFLVYHGLNLCNNVEPASFACWLKTSMNKLDIYIYTLYIYIYILYIYTVYINICKKVYYVDNIYIYTIKHIYNI